jgi:hypothetical protein
MKQLAFLVLISLFSQGCGNDQKNVEDPFLSKQLDKLKNAFDKRLKSNENQYEPALLELNYLDQQISKHEERISVMKDADSIIPELNNCKKEFENIRPNCLDKETQQNIIGEFEFLINNKIYNNQCELKEHLQNVQYMYWNSITLRPLLPSFDFDEVDVFLSDTVGKFGKPFSTSIIPAGINSTKNIFILIGEGFSKDGKLTGKIDTIKTRRDHMPLFQTTTYKKGHNIIPAQRIMGAINGNIITYNFFIKFRID